MNDINFQATVEHVHITSAGSRRYQPPNITITNLQFAAGLAHGLQASLLDSLNRDRVLSDDDIIANMRIIFFEDETSNELAKQTDDEIAYACGALVGELLAKI